MQFYFPEKQVLSDTVKWKISKKDISKQNSSPNILCLYFVNLCCIYNACYSEEKRSIFKSIF